MTQVLWPIASVTERPNRPSCTICSLKSIHQNSSIKIVNYTIYEEFYLSGPFKKVQHFNIHIIHNMYWGWEDNYVLNGLSKSFAEVQQSTCNN